MPRAEAAVKSPSIRRRSELDPPPILCCFKRLSGQSRAFRRRPRRRSEHLCCKAGSSSRWRLAISASCSSSRATGTARAGVGRSGRMRVLIYPLSLAIYCTSWTFFGSVGSASRTGYEFLTIYIGPVLMVGLFSPLIIRIVRLAKAQNITSIADFIAARYGKAQPVAALVALIAIIGTIPYIALQLKAVSSSLETILAHVDPGSESDQPGARRHRAVRGDLDGDLRRAVRHPPHRRHRASGRPDAGGRRRIDHQAVRLPGGRRLRHLLDVRRPRRAVRGGAHAGLGDRPVHARAAARHLHRDDAAVVLRHHPAAAPVPRRGGREQQRERDQARRLAVSALSRADQPVRRADRASPAC